ncbi:MAG: sigma-70 family RNA polymerase sigma factor, partial [Lachnospiraceae bacterium]|nr:sigma-70 family RNA polymerase sigma factor [Lachnospiraceae bacterium]
FQVKELYEKLEKLPPRERVIICLRYGLGPYDRTTQREIAEKLHISRSYVSRIEKKALERLRAEMEQ